MKEGYNIIERIIVIVALVFGFDMVESWSGNSLLPNKISFSCHVTYKQFAKNREKTTWNCGHAFIIHSNCLQLDCYTKGKSGSFSVVYFDVLCSHSQVAVLSPFEPV